MMWWIKWGALAFCGMMGLHGFSQWVNPTNHYVMSLAERSDAGGQIAIIFALVVLAIWNDWPND